jgi:hypothetical protein
VTILELTSERVFKVVGDPAVYPVASYLTPMKASALALAARYRHGCKTCHRPMYLRNLSATAGAFTRLVRDQYAKDPASLAPLRAIILKILGLPDGTQVMLRYTETNQDKQLVF